LNIDKAGGSGSYTSWQLAGYAANGATVTAANTEVPAVGVQTFSVPAGLSYAVGQRVRFVASGAAAYMEGIPQGYAGTVMTVTVDTVSGTGNYSSWQLLADGVSGTASAATNTEAPASGQQTFTVPAGLAYRVGQRIRFVASGGSAYMEGVLQSYSGTA